VTAATADLAVKPLRCGSCSHRQRHRVITTDGDNSDSTTTTAARTVTATGGQ
jgi:hypothetical protein